MWTWWGSLFLSCERRFWGPGQFTDFEDEMGVLKNEAGEASCEKEADSKDPAIRFTGADWPLERAFGNGGTDYRVL